MTHCFSLENIGPSEISKLWNSLQERIYSVKLCHSLREYNYQKSSVAFLTHKIESKLENYPRI